MQYENTEYLVSTYTRGHSSYQEYVLTEVVVFVRAWGTETCTQ